VKNNEVVHWSHALGVRESARNLGIGRQLKDYQRAELARLGIRSMYWTFDPLIAKNAHFNLNRLGARVVEYVPDMYGTTKSPLHHGLATDRFVVVCSTTPTVTLMRRLRPRSERRTSRPRSGSRFPRISIRYCKLHPRSPPRGRRRSAATFSGRSATVIA